MAARREALLGEGVMGESIIQRAFGASWQYPRPMRKPTNRRSLGAALTLLAAAGALGGCDRSGSPPWDHETLWSDGKDRVELDKRYETSMQETTLVYRVRVLRAGKEIIAQSGISREARLSPAATRLADGRVAWRADGILCVTTDGQPLCADLKDLACAQDAPSPTCDGVVKTAVTCDSVLAPSDARLTAALGWALADKDLTPELRVAALTGLARGGDVPRDAADALEKGLGPRSETTRLWIAGALARAGGDPARVEQLRRVLGKQRCETIAVGRSCVPELAADMATARGRLMARRPDLAADIAAAEEECAHLPKPARAR
jgi:hypothetical protein